MTYHSLMLVCWNVPCCLSVQWRYSWAYPSLRPAWFPAECSRRWFLFSAPRLQTERTFCECSITSGDQIQEVGSRFWNQKFHHGSHFIFRRNFDTTPSVIFLVFSPATVAVRCYHLLSHGRFGPQMELTPQAEFLGLDVVSICLHVTSCTENSNSCDTELRRSTSVGGGRNHWTASTDTDSDIRYSKLSLRVSKTLLSPSPDNGLRALSVNQNHFFVLDYGCGEFRIVRKSNEFYHSESACTCTPELSNKAVWSLTWRYESQKAQQISWPHFGLASSSVCHVFLFFFMFSQTALWPNSLQTGTSPGRWHISSKTNESWIILKFKKMNFIFQNKHTFNKFKFIYKLCKMFDRVKLGL